MTAVWDDFVSRARTERAWWVAAGLIVVAFSYPFLVETLRELPVLGEFVPEIRSVRCSTSRANSSVNASSASRTASSNRDRTRCCSCS